MAMEMRGRTPQTPQELSERAAAILQNAYSSIAEENSYDVVQCEDDGQRMLPAPRPAQGQAARKRAVKAAQRNDPRTGTTIVVTPEGTRVQRPGHYTDVELETSKRMAATAHLYGGKTKGRKKKGKPGPPRPPPGLSWHFAAPTTSSYGAAASVPCPPQPLLRHPRRPASSRKAVEMARAADIAVRGGDGMDDEPYFEPGREDTSSRGMNYKQSQLLSELLAATLEDPVTLPEVGFPGWLGYFARQEERATLQGLMGRTPPEFMRGGSARGTRSASKATRNVQSAGSRPRSTNGHGGQVGRYSNAPTPDIRSDWLNVRLGDDSRSNSPGPGGPPQNQYLRTRQSRDMLTLSPVLDERRSGSAEAAQVLDVQQQQQVDGQFPEGDAATGAEGRDGTADAGEPKGPPALMSRGPMALNPGYNQGHRLNTPQRNAKQRRDQWTKDLKFARFSANPRKGIAAGAVHPASRSGRHRMRRSDSMASFYSQISAPSDGGEGPAFQLGNIAWSRHGSRGPSPQYVAQAGTTAAGVPVAVDLDDGAGRDAETDERFRQLFSQPSVKGGEFVDPATGERIATPISDSRSGRQERAVHPASSRSASNAAPSLSYAARNDVSAQSAVTTEGGFPAASRGERESFSPASAADSMRDGGSSPSIAGSIAEPSSQNVGKGAAKGNDAADEEEDDDYDDDYGDDYDSHTDDDAKTPDVPASEPPAGEVGADDSEEDEYTDVDEDDGQSEASQGLGYI